MYRILPEHLAEHDCLQQIGNPGVWQQEKWGVRRMAEPRNHWHFWMAGGHWETQLLCLWAPSQNPLCGWWFDGFPPGAAPVALSDFAELRFGSKTEKNTPNMYNILKYRVYGEYLCRYKYKPLL